jgi:HK97 family phage prohead protease
MNNTRGYSAFQVKAVDEGARRFTGWATTPATDRVGDTINSLGASFQNPIVLLHQHKHDKPIGRVMLKKPTAKGIEFEAEIPNVADPGEFKDRVDLAWDEIRHGVVRAVSIGFRPIKYAYKEDGGIDFQEIEIYELSTVSVPALPQAIITSIKSMEPISADVVRMIAESERKGAVKLMPPTPRSGAVPLIRN